MRALAAPATTVGSVTPAVEWLSIALPRPADACYELFCRVERIPEWLKVVRSATIVRRDGRDRPIEAAFLATLHRATVGYTCHYRYDDRRRFVTWSTAAGRSVRVAGFSQFSPLGQESCLMTYGLDLDLGHLPGWSDSNFSGHAASATMSDFRDYVIRIL